MMAGHRLQHSPSAKTASESLQDRAGQSTETSWQPITVFYIEQRDILLYTYKPVSILKCRYYNYNIVSLRLKIILLKIIILLIILADSL